ncbi:MAG: hypothetical protein EU981_04375 [Candidatus Liberibacter ctenarytainae]|uniref:Uncharacterized protein n=1 Tax=Candidatus Liberibacter ctenarytainae TaxID=2020335 RepID=A0A937ASN4_9HYPH|nr:hypothetical protein [Candidatus Liberibacter ctenarytainae]
MNVFDFHTVCSGFPVSGFFIFVVLYTIVCASIIGTWKYGVYKHPALDMIASIICGLLMSILIVLFMFVKDNRIPFERAGIQINPDNQK